LYGRKTSFPRKYRASSVIKNFMDFAIESLKCIFKDKYFFEIFENGFNLPKKYLKYKKS